MILYTNLNNIREKKKIIIPESKLALLSEAQIGRASCRERV